MFTGLIEAVCDVKSVSPGTASGGSLVVDLGGLVPECRTGDSIAVSGVCLTVTRLAGTVATFGLSPETLERSTLGLLRPSAKVNIERAMRRPTGWRPHRARPRRWHRHDQSGQTARRVCRYRVRRRAACWADGAQGLSWQWMVSLTIAGIGSEGFRVAAIPETLNRTTLGNAYIGGRVNIETDVLVKIVRRQLEAILPPNKR
jgi:riboflavin synthase